MNTGEKIRYFRNKKSMSQKQLGKKSGVSEITIRKYEAGNVPTTLDTLAKLASALDVSLQALRAGQVFANNKTQADIMKELAEYQETGLEPEEIMYMVELKQQGRLIELPCKVGDMVFLIFNDFGELFLSTGWIVEEVTITEDDIFFDFKCCETNEEEERVLKDFGKTVFLTKEEAEQALSK
ncbi:MAG: helix-turn-helix domain-containing protein [Anaerotignaceae bacterium]